MSTKLKAGTSTSGAVLDADTSGILELQTGSTPTTAVTIDASQNVGIGTASPSLKLDVVGGIRVNEDGAGTKVIQIRSNWAGVDPAINVQSNNSLLFNTNGTERMRIDSSGRLLVGTTTSLADKFTVNGGDGPQMAVNTTTRFTQFNFCNSGTAKGYIFYDNTDARFYVQNVSSGVYLANGGIAWIANSDERLKENLLPITDAINKVSTLRAVTGNYIADADKKSRSFLIAQDVQAVLPEAVDSSNPDQLGVAYTDLIPLLVASIKELNAKVTALEAQLGAK